MTECPPEPTRRSSEKTSPGIALSSTIQESHPARIVLHKVLSGEEGRRADSQDRGPLQEREDRDRPMLIRRPGGGGTHSDSFICRMGEAICIPVYTVDTPAPHANQDKTEDRGRSAQAWEAFFEVREGHPFRPRRCEPAATVPCLFSIALMSETPTCLSSGANHSLAASPMHVGGLCYKEEW
jgi:hypothetical protein